MVMRTDGSIAKCNGLSKKQMRANREKLNPGYVYFLRMGEDGPIKIGKAQDPSRRLFGLQTGNPIELKMILLVRNSELEPAFHEKFWDHRIRGEWFYPDVELENFMAVAIQKSVGSKDVAGKPIPVGECSEKDLPSIRSSATKAVAERESMHEINGSSVPMKKVLKLLRLGPYGRKPKSDGDMETQKSEK